MEHITANIVGSTQRRHFGGREYLVAPVTMLREGVLDANKGPLLYPKNEIRKSVQQWNGMPIVVNHPKVDGEYVSARSPEILEKVEVGIVFNSQYRNKLVAEAWIDIEKADAIDTRIVESLESQQPISVSTGLVTTDIPVEGGVFNGRKYIATATAYKPDHLALLLDSDGACSLDDGCGLGVNSTEAKGLWKRFGQMLGIIDKNSEPVTEGESFKMTKLTANERKDIIDGLVANCEGCPKTDRDSFEKLSDAVLTSLKDNQEKAEQQEEVSLAANAAKKGIVDQQGNKMVWNGKKGEWDLVPATPKAEPTANTQAKPKSADEWMAEAPEELRDMIANQRRKTEQEKGILIGELTANIKNKKERQAMIDKLSKKSLEDLEDIRTFSANAGPDDDDEDEEGDDGEANGNIPSYHGRQFGFSAITGNRSKKHNPSVLTANDKKDVLEDLEVDFSAEEN